MSNTSSMTWDHDGWSDLNHDVLSLVMMKLGISEFVACSRVCKSWRSLALSDQNKFMVSKPPVGLQKSPCNKKECYFKDLEGRMSKVIIPHLSNMELLGVTRGYLILLKTSTLDLCLVNPITRHELHFPGDELAITKEFMVLDWTKTPRVILVFSPSLSGWVLVVLLLRRETGKIWYSVVGKGEWNNVSSNFFILDVIAFKGKIYTLVDSTCPLCELRLHPEPKLTSLETKNFPYLEECLKYTMFVSAGENLHVWVIEKSLVFELDFGQMKWVSLEKTKKEYMFFVSNFNHGVAVKQESWADPRLLYRNERYEPSGYRFLFGNMWYFPHECLNFGLIDE